MVESEKSVSEVEKLRKREKSNRMQTRLVWIFGVETTNKFLGMVEFVSRDPCGLFISSFVTGPSDQVPELTSEAAIQFGV